jgi:hypothetical protein
MVMNSGDTTNILTYVVPFVLFFGFWVFLARRGRMTAESAQSTEQATLDVLTEIRDELRRLREAVEGGGSGFRSNF